MRTKLLSGIRILDLTRVMAGPWATQLLADLGAEVIKVERPGIGDDARRVGPAFLKSAKGRGDSSVFLSMNRNKRSITVDLSKPDGQELIRKLAAKSDMFVENYKVGDLARYGLDYPSIKSINPQLIYCSITGFGQSGPDSQELGYDPIFQARGGLMSLTGHPDGEPGGGPMKIGPAVTDLFGGFYAALGLLAAIYHRDLRGGTGQYIDLAILDSLVAMLSRESMQYIVSGVPYERRGNQTAGGASGGIYRCSDGVVMITMGNDGQFARFCEALGVRELISDKRFMDGPSRSENGQVLRKILEPLMRSRTVSQALAVLSSAGVPAGPVNDLASVFDDPQVRHRQMVVEVDHPQSHALRMIGNPLRFSETPISDYEPPPMLGQQTDEVLRQVLGMDDASIAVLRQARAI